VSPFHYLLLLPLLVLICLQGSKSFDAREQYARAHQLFVQGFLGKSQEEAELGYQQSLVQTPDWAWKFRLLEAQAMVWRGMYVDSLRILESLSIPRKDLKNATILKLALQGVAQTRLHRLTEADQTLKRAEGMCAASDASTCGEVMRARGVWAFEIGESGRARESFLRSLDFARAHQDSWLEATAILNMGAASLQQEHYDEAADWSRKAYAIARDLGGNDLGQVAQGNLGWAYYRLGDQERSLDNFLDAEKSATELGDVLYQIRWLMTAGRVYQSSGNQQQASQAFTRALALARQINSTEDVINSLENLTQTSIDAGKIDEAASYLEQLGPLAHANGSHLDELDAMYAAARIAAARRQDRDAERGFSAVERDGESQTWMRLGAEHDLARLYEAQGNYPGADRMYRTSLKTFESAREQLNSEESKLPFLANANGIYDDYIHFLVERGRTDEALELADQSRARTLGQGLGVETDNRSSMGLRPSEIARRLHATLLFYWMGEKQSYLWAITPTRMVLIRLAAERDVLPEVERYRKALVGLGDPIESGNRDGAALYRELIAPATNLIQRGSTVFLLCDGPLSQLNFETLIVPDQSPHYFIEDATLISAPSLRLLSQAKPPESSAHKLLLVGDAVSPGPDYPELPMAATEMKQVEQHFSPQEETVFAREEANATSYTGSSPQQFEYIHFVTHGVASRTDPLDSAIILSRSTSAEDSFKLHAREIMQHPLHARLVTISACYGSGTRSYVGEGLVGLAWAFLRAGAHNVIGALWEVSDQSTAQLMDGLYQGLRDGKSPAIALREAKLALLHSRGNFRKPFFWAPLQVYTGL
jgi:CHAT domain-containing protein